MINVKDFYERFRNKGIVFFAGVPDSLLKDICAYIADNASPENHIITANEGSAIALGAGYHLATNKVPLIYMQNSGVGNAVNPLLSLADREVYSIPMMLLIGWRGEPGVKDEPQHIKQGRVLTDILESIEMPYFVIDCDSDYEQVIESAHGKCLELMAPVAILVRKNTFAPYKLCNDVATNYEMSREEALSNVLKHIPDNSVVVSTTGMLSRELFEIRESKNQSHQTDFLTVGSMGHTLQIAIGIALGSPDKMVYCLDGDGSAIMHLGNYAVAGSLNLANLRIILFNNGAHDSVGGQLTVGNQIIFGNIVKASNIKDFGTVRRKSEITEDLISDFRKSEKISFLEIKIKKGARNDLGRPKTTPIENKEALQLFLQKDA